jgi:hypothetical protein
VEGFHSQPLDDLFHPPDMCVPGLLEAVDVPLCRMKQAVDLPLVLQHEILVFDLNRCDCALLCLGKFLPLATVCIGLDPPGALKLLEKGDSPSVRVGMSSCLTGPTAHDRQIRVVVLAVRN